MLRLSSCASSRPFHRSLLGGNRSYQASNMRMTNIDTSPPVHRGMSQLDKDAFRKEVSIIAARVPAAKAGVILRASETKRRVAVRGFIGHRADCSA
jgi:hypothetical protein